MLRLQYNSEGEIPEGFATLYTKRGDVWVLTGVQGMKTQSDIDAVTTAKQHEIDARKKAEDALKAFAGKDPVEVLAQLDKIEEYKIMAEKGGVDEDKIEELVEKRFQAKIQTVVGPLNREIETLTTEKGELTEANTGFKKADTKRTIHDALRDAGADLKVIPTAMEDALMLAERQFEVIDGKVVTKADNGVTPGVDAAIWWEEMSTKKPHWFPASEGGGANPGSIIPGISGNNPWAKGTWNQTQQAMFAKKHGMEKATQMAKLAGVEVTAHGPAQ